MRRDPLPTEWLMLLLLGLGQVESQEWVKANVVRRATKPVYIIDTLVVIDDVMFARWTAASRPTASSSTSTATGTQLADEDVKEYVSLVIRQANDRLSTLVDHLDYSLELQVVDFLTNQAVIDSVTPNPTTGRRSGDDALETFREWVVARNLGPQYDHIILLTGYDIEGVFQGVVSNYLKGKAYVATMCNTDGLSLSLVEDRGGFQSAFYVAHEVAHSLGSGHDGADLACSDSDRYIMAGQDAAVTSSNLRNPWYFSSCSARAIDVYTAPRLSSSCFTVNGQPAAEFTATVSLVAGQLYGANAQCQMIYGSESRFCLRGVSGELENICTKMLCLETSNALIPQCASHFAAEGTTCGNKKWCQRGQCVTSEEAPELLESECQYGDSVQLVQGRFTCSQYVAQVPAACYDDDFRAACCSSCANARTDSEVCPYRDRLTGCRSDECEFLLPSGVLYAHECCGTCSYNTERECNDVTSLDGVSCAKRAAQQNIQGCYNLTVAFHCCQTCAQLRTGGEGCEYGDLDLLCSSNLRNDPSSQCLETSVQTRCCRSCDDSNGNGNSGASVLRGHTVVSDVVTWFTAAGGGGVVVVMVVAMMAVVVVMVMMMVE